MAFYNKLGGLLRQSISTSSNALNAQASAPSMFNAIRCMSTKLFVGGLSYGTDDQSLKEAFASFGDIVDGSRAKVIVDRDSGRSRGFGFVNYSDGESAKEAVTAMDGQQLNGRNIHVNFAQERAPRSGGFGSGGAGGGYGGSRGDDSF